MTVIFSHSSGSGGAEIALPELATTLDAWVLAIGDGPLQSSLRQAHVPHVSLPAVSDSRQGGIAKAILTVLNLIKSNVRLVALLRRHRHETVIANTVQGMLHLTLASILLRLNVICYIRDLGFGGNRPNWLVRVFRFIVRIACSAVIYNSNLTRDTWDLPKSSIIVRTAISERYFEAGDRRLKESATPLQPRVLVLGRLALWKGQVDVASACGTLVGEFPQLELTCVGEDAFGVAPIPRILSAFPGTRLPGHTQSPWTALEQADLLVHASRTPEPLGQVLAQAAAAGVPIVCANSGGHMEWLCDGASCAAFRMGDVRDMAGRIRDVVLDPKASKLRAEAAFEAAQQFRSSHAYAELVTWVRVEGQRS